MTGNLGVVSEDLKRLVRVFVHVEFGMDCAEESAIRPDHKGGPLARQWPEALHAKELGDIATGVREEGKTEVVLFVEGFLPVHRIGADPNALGREFGELRRQVAEVTAFNRSTRGHRFGVEEQNHRSVRDELAQTDSVAVLVGRREIVDEIIRIHGGHFLSVRVDRAWCANEPYAFGGALNSLP